MLFKYSGDPVTPLLTSLCNLFLIPGLLTQRIGIGGGGGGVRQENSTGG